MKIYVYYEDNRKRTPIEVPDEECAAWVERDYQKRFADAEGKNAADPVNICRSSGLLMKGLQNPTPSEGV